MVGSVVVTMGAGDRFAWLRWYFGRNSRARTIKLRRAKPPITPPTMAPVLMQVEEAAAETEEEAEELPELVVVETAGVPDGGAEDCDIEVVLIDVVFADTSFVVSIIEGPTVVVDTVLEITL
jgi:hypothetical protein